MAYLKQILRGSLIVTMMLILFTPAYAANHFKKGSLLRITIFQALLKDSPHSFGSTLIKKLLKGSSVTYIETSGIYYRVSYKQQTGYITAKSVVESKKVLKASLVREK